ncbi:hypothetical protein EBV26_12130 [bacterium]|nr:hypothetical protein [bacterium]
MKIIPSIVTLLFLFIGIPSSSISNGAKICRSTSLPFHTWVQMDYSCSQAGNCDIRTPFTRWNDIGYENGNGGTLRDEAQNPGGVYRCSSWFIGELQGKVARATTAQQERSAISALINAGWNTAQYGLIAGGLSSITCDPTTWSWTPRSGKNNVCWTFTCAYATYLYRVLGVRPSATVTELSLKNRPEIPLEWTCNPAQYGSGDGCHCNCGVFDPDCNPFEAVSINCPNNDDICIPGPLNQPVCALRHEVLSDRKLIQIQSGVAVHHPQFFFSNDTDVDGAPWGNYTKTYTRNDIPATWTCNPLFYGSKDGCDCECGAWDPDCEVTKYSQKVFNCDTTNNEVRCVMSRNTPSAPVCLYDRMAASAAVDAGYHVPDNSTPTLSTSVIVTVSVGITLGVVVITAIVIGVVMKRRQILQRRQSVQQMELMQFNITS